MVVNFSRLFTGGLLVFFPSYAVMEACVEFWTNQADAQGKTILQRLRTHKHVVIEPRQSSLLQQTMSEYYGHVKESVLAGRGGAAFFAVDTAFAL